MCCIVPNITLSLVYQIKKMKTNVVLKSVLIGLALILSVIRLSAQEKQDSLYKEIVRMDSVLFDAFNKRNMERFSTLFTEDLEFYHDKGGLTGYQHTIDFLKDISKPGNDLKRELVKGSTEIYPIPGYGAMQIGIHRFCHTQDGKQDCGNFKFIHIWQKKNNEWKISRIISYDH